MEAIYFYETSVDFQQTTRRYIPEDGTLHNHRFENLKSYTLCIIKASRLIQFMKIILAYYDSDAKPYTHSASKIRFSLCACSWTNQDHLGSIVNPTVGPGIAWLLGLKTEAGGA
jgi:hypothetical protein